MEGFQVTEILFFVIHSGGVSGNWNIFHCSSNRENKVCNRFEFLNNPIYCLCDYSISQNYVPDLPWYFYSNVTGSKPHIHNLGFIVLDSKFWKFCDYFINSFRSLRKTKKHEDYPVCFRSFKRTITFFKPLLMHEGGEDRGQKHMQKHLGRTTVHR